MLKSFYKEGNAMFSIKIERVFEECYQLEKMHNEYYQLCGELEDAIRMLDSMASTRHMTEKLWRQVEIMDEQQEMMRQLALGLDSVSFCYRKCEKWICDNCEQTVAAFPREDAGTTDLNRLGELLNRIIY